MRYSAGLGATWLSPFGPLNVSLSKEVCDNLSFTKPNHQIFPCLNLAYEALDA